MKPSHPLWKHACFAVAACLIATTALSGEGPAVLPATGATPKTIKVIDDIAYRSGDSKAWRLDLAVPEDFGGEKHPALVIVHGGGWRAGSKRDRPYRTMLVDYALKGYVTLS